MNYEIGQINLIDNTGIIPVFKSSNKKKPNDVNSFPTDSLQEYELLKMLKKNQFDFQHKHYTSILLHLFVMDQLGNF